MSIAKGVLGNVSRKVDRAIGAGPGGISLSSYWTTPEGIALKAKMLLWTIGGEEETNYYINRIGDQDRLATLEGGAAGVIHPGRAISYDGAKSQYSQSLANVSALYKIYDNNISVSFKVKMASKPANITSCIILPLISISVATTGLLTAVLATVETTRTIRSDSSVADGYWHDILVVVNKAGNYVMYVDGQIQDELWDISANTYSNADAKCNIGGSTGFFSGVKYLRDIRFFNSAIISDADILALRNGDYLANCTAWYMCEENKASAIYPLSDATGNMHLKVNSAFDATSLVSGAWPSLFNRYGYSNLAYEGSDVLLGDGTFDNAALWTFTGTIWGVADGVATFKGAGDNTIATKRVLSFAAGDIIKLQFTVSVANASISFLNSSSQVLSAQATYNIGTHTVIFRSVYACTQIRMKGWGTSFVVDNFTMTSYSAAMMPPLMTSASPTLDIFSRSLTFKGLAKLPLLKVSEAACKMTDNDGYLIDATNYITVNDWFNAGTANELNYSALSYQSFRQYYNNSKKELILFSDDAGVTVAEDIKLKQYMKISATTAKYRGGICLTFDDQWLYDNIDSWIAADALYSQYGWKATFMIATPFTNTTEQDDIDTMNLYKTKFLQLVASGHELGDHTLRHKSYFEYFNEGNTNQDYYDDRIEPMQSVMDTILGYKPVTYAYSDWFGKGGAMSDLILAENDGFTAVRENCLTLPAAIDRHELFWNGKDYNGVINRLVLYALDLHNYHDNIISDADILSLLEHARDNNVILNVFSHNIKADGSSPLTLSYATLTMICQFIVNNNMSFYRMDELADVNFGF